VNDFEYLREIDFTSLKSQNVPQELARLCEHIVIMTIISTYAASFGKRLDRYGTRHAECMHCLLLVG
jgi:hypothetical protein